jgi:hypothetical protein
MKPWIKPTPIDRDRLFSTTRDAAVAAAFNSLTHIQNLPPEEMTAGLGLLFAAVCERAGIDAQDLHTLGARMLKAPNEFHLKENGALQSLRDFAGIRVKGDRDVSVM